MKALMVLGLSKAGKSLIVAQAMNGLRRNDVQPEIKSWYQNNFPETLCCTGLCAATKFILKILFGGLEVRPLHLQQFFITTLIKKGRGLWPDEALATLTMYSVVRRCQLHP